MTLTILPMLMVFDPDPGQDRLLELAAARRIVVVAPPGTGKTFSSVRLAAVTAATLSPHQHVLLLTFSNNARAQLHREARRLVPVGVRSRLAIMNYHQFFRSKIWAYRRALGLPDRLELIGKSERIGLLRQRLGQRLLRGVDADVWSEILQHTIEAFRTRDSPPIDLTTRAVEVVRESNATGEIHFDDFGFYYWQLVTQFPIVEQAIRAAYPVVIADEHQDASALQDEVVRRLAMTSRLVLFADSLQLIHGWRGADESRLNRHLAEADVQIELGTMHRWTAERELGVWLLRVRRRFLNQPDEQGSLAPTQVTVSHYATDRHQTRQAFPVVAAAVRDSFSSSCRSVAVLCPWNAHVSELRDYLTRQGMYPRQVGGPDAFEFSRDLIRALPAARTCQDLAQLALSTLEGLVPQMEPQLVRQIGSRIRAEGPHLLRAGQLTGAILTELGRLWSTGAEGFFAVLCRCIEICDNGGYHVPKSECLGPLRAAAQAESDRLSRYRDAVALSRFHAAFQEPTGLFVMTVHQAKGKEFQAVVVVFVDRRAFPDNVDAKRLLYVALTRARKRLYLVVPRTDPSPLLQLLPL